MSLSPDLGSFNDFSYFRTLYYVQMFILSFSFKLFTTYLFNVCLFSVYHVCAWCPHKPEEGVIFPEEGVRSLGTADCELQVGTGT